MAELRNDWLTGRSVIVAENRALRPNEFAPDVASSSSTQMAAKLALAEAGLTEAAGVPSCPFCVGSEPRTPPALYEKLDAKGRWQVRVVPNMFPAVEPEQSADSASPALGAHEVIVESARHVDRTSALSICQLQQVLETYALRLRHWRDDGRFRYGLVFKNQGPRAGASISHLHSQFMALATVPQAVDAELRRAERRYRQNQTCPYCQLIEDERTLGERIVDERDGYVAFCPFASLQPHEVWLLPVCHEPSFERFASPEATARLADVLHALLKRLELIVPDGAYNLLLRTAPWHTDCDNRYHWRMELLPRVNPLAGFELATGVQINPLAPEAASRQLRAT